MNAKIKNTNNVKKQIHNKIIRLAKYLFLKLVRLNDSPQKVAMGFGIGAFLGILPGTGPLAALLLAAFLKINKAAAFLGSLLTNTWLSVVTIMLSVKIGSSIMGLEWHHVWNTWQKLLKDFHWKQVLDLSFLKLILPVITGYLILSALLGFFVYVAALLILTFLKKKRKKREAGVKNQGSSSASS